MRVENLFPSDSITFFEKMFGLGNLDQEEEQDGWNMMSDGDGDISSFRDAIYGFAWYSLF